MSSVLNCPQTDTEDDHPILCKEVEAAVQSLKKEKSAGADNIPAELVQVHGEDVITVLTTICDRVWQDWRMANTVDPFLSHRTSKQRQPATVSELPNDQPHQSPKQTMDTGELIFADLLHVEKGMKKNVPSLDHRLVHLLLIYGFSVWMFPSGQPSKRG